MAVTVAAAAAEAAAAANVASLALRPRLRTLLLAVIGAAIAVCKAAPISEPGELGGESLMALTGSMGTSIWLLMVCAS